MQPNVRKGNPQRELALLERALARHKAGRLSEARELYATVLRRAPDCADAMHLLGVACGQQGEHEVALRWIREASERLPDNAVVRKNLGDTLLQLGRVDEARDAYTTAIELQEGFADAWCALGSLLIDHGQAEAAVELLSAAEGRFPDSPQILFQLARALQKTGRPVDAAYTYARTLELDPRHCRARNNLGVIFDQAGDTDQALAQFRQAVEDDPNYAHGLKNLTAVLVKFKRYDEALPHLERAVRLLPGDAVLWNQLGLAAHELQRLDDAEHYYQRALEVDPDNADALTNLGNLRFDLERDGEAEALYRRAVAADPINAEALNGLRSVLVKSGRDEEAVAVTERLLSVKPDHPTGRFYLAWTMLGHGLFEDGFREYRWRPSRQDLTAVPPGCTPAERLPDDLRGARILLYKDQGIGDEIFFLRFAAWLRRRGAWVRYLCTPKIASLVARSGVVDEVVTEHGVDPTIGLAVNVGDLPFLLGFREAADIPPSIPLSALPERVVRAQAMLREFGPPPYTAVTWRAGRDKLRYIGRMVRSLSKSLPMEVLAGYLPREGTVVSLQRQANPGEVEALSQLLGRPVLDLDALNEDLEGMLGVLAVIDAYYTVSNANVHLVAGLGKTATVFVPYPPEWRWMTAGEESPWFPGFPIIREYPQAGWPRRSA